MNLYAVPSDWDSLPGFPFRDEPPDGPEYVWVDTPAGRIQVLVTVDGFEDEADADYHDRQAETGDLPDHIKRHAYMLPAPRRTP